LLGIGVVQIEELVGLEGGQAEYKVSDDGAELLQEGLWAFLNIGLQDLLSIFKVSLNELRHESDVGVK